MTGVQKQQPCSMIRVFLEDNLELGLRKSEIFVKEIDLAFQ